MKRLFILIAIISVALTGCLKDKPNVDFSNIKPVVEISTANFTSTANTLPSGQENFGNATLIFAIIDSNVTFDVNYASVNPPASDVKVTVGVNDAARTAYNGSSDIQYLPFPDGSYSLDTPTVTIKAGTRVATVHVSFKPSLIDPTKSYLLPISITDASGNAISGNFNTIYLHQVGNPIAGSYTQEWIRYNTATQTGTPAFDQTFGATFIPISPTEISVDSGTGVTYLLSFTNDNGVLSDFQVQFDPQSVTNAGITIDEGPKIIVADPINHKFEFNFRYTNSAGSPRNITDKFSQ